MKQIFFSFLFFIGLLLASVTPLFGETVTVTDVFTPEDVKQNSTHTIYNNVVKSSGAVYSMKVNNTHGAQLGLHKDYESCIYTSQSKGKLKGIRLKWASGEATKNHIEVLKFSNALKELTEKFNPIYEGSLNSTGKIINFTSKEAYYDLSSEQISYVALRPTSDSNACYFTKIEFVWEVENTSTKEQVAAPTFDLNSQHVYTEPQTLHLSCTTPGASIYYTLDGTMPTVQSTLYREGGIVLRTTTKVKAIALKEGMLPSPVAEATYTFDQASDYFVYTKVTSVDELHAGDTYLLVGHDSGKDYVLSYQRKNSNSKEANNRHGLPVTFDANGCVQLRKDKIATIVYQNAVYELELRGESGKWLLYDPIYKGYLYAVNMSSNNDNFMNTSSQIHSGTSGRESSYLDISFAEGGKAILDFHHGKLESGKFSIMCNVNIFSCYNRSSTTVSDKVYLYRKVRADEGLIRMSAAGCGTLYLDKAFTMPAGLQGGIITQAEGSNHLNIDYCYDEGQVVPAKTPLLIKGAEGLYLYRQTADQQAQAPTVQQSQATNLLHGEVDADGMTFVPGTSRYYKLSYDSNGQNLGFYWGAPDGGPFKNSEGKAYLALPTTSGALTQQVGFSLEGMQDITGISTPEVHSAAPSAIYLIDGRRVPTNDVKQLPKGLYIINGQKQLIP